MTWIFSGLALLCFVGSWFLHRAARGADDFGMGIIFWVAIALGVVFVLVAALLLVANLYASGFR